MLFLCALDNEIQKLFPFYLRKKKKKKKSKKQANSHMFIYLSSCKKK